MNFDPIAKRDDFITPRRPEYIVYSAEQRYGYNNGTLKRDIRNEVAKLAKCDLLVLNFPVFWFSVPAILKGWLDRILIAGLCYSAGNFYDRGGLAGKRALVTATIGSREHMFGERAIHGEFACMFKHLLQGTLAYSGLEVVQPFVVWRLPHAGRETKRHILHGYHNHLLNLDATPALSMPSLKDFDRFMRPLTPRPKARKRKEM